MKEHRISLKHLGKINLLETAYGFSGELLLNGRWTAVTIDYPYQKELTETRLKALITFFEELEKHDMENRTIIRKDYVEPVSYTHLTLPTIA